MSKLNYKPSAEQLLALQTQLTTAFNDVFGAVDNTFKKIATVMPMSERGLTFSWLTSDDDLEEFDPNVGRVIKHLDVHAAKVDVKKYTKTTGVTFEDIRDGKTPEAVLAAAGVGRSAKRHPDRLVYGVLKNNSMCLYDGKPLFAADHAINNDDATKGTFSNEDMSGDGPTWYIARPESHPVLFGVRTGEDYSFGTLGADSELAFMKEVVLFGVRCRVVAAGGLPQFIYRSNKPLTPANLEAAVAAMEAVVGPEGQPIVNSPTHIFVPKSLRAAAKRIINGDKNDKGGYNEWYGSMDLTVSDYL
ncbi:Mu-like prophage major head subunit gpT [compost metagenome]